MFTDRGSLQASPASGAGGRVYTSKQRLWGRILGRLEFAVIMGTVFFSPMNFLRLPFFYFTLSDALACISLCLLMFQGRLTVRPIGAAGSFYWFSGLSLLLLGLIFSSIVYGDALRGLVFAIQYFFAYFVILLVITARSYRHLLVLAATYVFSIFAMCLHGIYLVNIAGERNTAFVSGSGRLTGFVERENECAALIALAVPLLLFISSKGGWWRLSLLALPVMGYGVMLTGSNTGLGSFAFAIAMFLALTLNWKLILPVAGLAAAIVAAIDHWGRAYLPDAFQRRVLGALETGDIGQAGSFDHRLELIHEAMNRANHTIFLGMGADQYAVTSFLQQPVHNLYLLLWTEGGPLCMLGFIVMIAAGFGPAMRAFNAPGGRHVAASAFTVIVLFLLCINAFPSVYGRFWVMPVVLGVALAHAYQAPFRAGSTVPMFARRPGLR